MKRITPADRWRKAAAAAIRAKVNEAEPER
jgi:hypothetical protein